MACGDALGAGLEFMTPEAIKERFGVVTDFAGGGPFDWPAGHYTDDTELALRLAESLIAYPNVNLADISRKWLEWLDSDPRDVGNLTRAALLRVRACLQSNRDPREAGQETWVATGRDSAGNGGLMRTAPVGLRYAWERKRLLEAADDICAITHYDPRARASCRAFCLAISQFLTEEGQRAIDLHALAEAVADLSPPTAEAITAVFDLEAADIPSSGYTLHTLQAALWPVERCMSLEEGIILVVNLGYDTDTCGAVAGALLGARDGEEAIPTRWLKTLHNVNYIREIADRLYEIASTSRPVEARAP